MFRIRIRYTNKLKKKRKVGADMVNKEIRIQASMKGPLVINSLCRKNFGRIQPCLSNMAATRHTWLLSTENAANPN